MGKEQSISLDLTGKLIEVGNERVELVCAYAGTEFERIVSFADTALLEEQSVVCLQQALIRISTLATVSANFMERMIKNPNNL